VKKKIAAMIASIVLICAGIFVYTGASTAVAVQQYYSCKYKYSQLIWHGLKADVAYSLATSGGWYCRESFKA
jgi:hypothetical protein